MVDYKKLLIEMVEMNEIKNRKQAQEMFLKLEEIAKADNTVAGLIALQTLEAVRDKVFKKVRGFEALPSLERPVELPKRQTRKSAGYDIRAAHDEVIWPGQSVLIRTGLTAYMQDDEFLDLRIRSGLASKYKLTLQNAAGVIDADYYGNEIGLLVRNEGHERFYLKRGDRIAQGIFVPYLITDDDAPVEDTRDGGFGHTGIN